MKRYDYVCEECGSDKITVDASVQWDANKQDWEVCNVYIHDRGFCPDCELEERAKCVELNPEGKP